MANVKISNLTAASTPVAGTEVLPIVQSGATVKVSIANLTPGLDTITAAKGGTGQTSYAVGDLLYASTTTALSKLADVATGNALISGGVNTAPSWGKIGLTTHVSGTLPTTNGGTGLSSFTANGVVYASSTSALTTGSALVFDGANLGVGVTPSAWGSNWKSLDQAYASSFFTNNGGYVGVGSNLYNDNTNYIYKSTGYATMYLAGSGNGQHRWFNAPSGTAGNTITFTQAMTLDASGNLGIVSTSPSEKLDIGSAGKIYLRRADNATGTKLNDGGSGVGLVLNQVNGDGFNFQSAGSTQVRIDSSGNLLVGVTSSSVNMITKSTAQGNGVLFVDNGTNVSFRAYSVSADGYNAAATAMNFGKNSSTSRSVNAGGTINAAGLDYAEYMIKAGDFTVAKGDVVGINSEGKLTNVFADAVSFVVKSTDPSYVGGDVWGSEEALGLTKPTDESTQQEKDAFNIALEAARQKVDRIAFAGQVPVNVMGATAGQYIIPVNDNGAIKGEAVSNPTFEQYQSAVGKVIAIESDGRAKIIVKVA